MTKIKVVVVDDSIFMRKAMKNMLADADDIEVIATGANGEDAVNLAKTLKPDVMTLDVEMPKMNGLTALGIIMKEAPLPVIMVSSLTQEGADTTIKALESGAADFIPKEKSFGSVGILKIANELKDKIRKFGSDKTIVRRLNRHISMPSSAASVRTPANHGAPSSGKVVNTKQHKKIVALGVSTGGPQSLQKVIPLLPGDLGVPVIIVQHMPPSFTASLAARLDAVSALTVVEAQGGERLRPNYVYIGKGGSQIGLKSTSAGVTIEIMPGGSQYLYNPCVDIMTGYVSDIYGKDALGVIMTGMGSDGAKGLKKLRDKGGFVIAQDEASSIVYGMPKAVVDSGIADEIVPLDEIAKRIEFHCKG